MLLRRARLNVETERRVLETSPQEHQRLLRAFIEAVRGGDVAGLTKMLAADAMVVADGGKNGVRFGQVRNLPRPLDGIRRITKFLTSASKRDGVPEVREQTLNGQPALVAVREGRVVAAILLSVAQGRIRRVFIHADPAHLAYVNVAAAVPSST
jgi:RNA polymerase sigma-70 factor (ECF subfamily)